MKEATKDLHLHLSAFGTIFALVLFYQISIVMIFNRKTIPAFFIGLCLLLSTSVFAQNTVNEVKDKSISALSSGDTEVFTSFFNNPIDVSLPYNDDSYSNTQAKVIVKKFLLQYKVKSFTVKQTGNSTDGSMFIIGLYTATNGQEFRVYLLIKKQASSAYIHLLEFEEE